MRMAAGVLLAVLALAASSSGAVEPLPDPTRPPIQRPTKGVQWEDIGSLTLSYTQTGQYPAVAVINGRRVRVGESLGDSMVVSGIHPGRVVLMRGEKVIEISLVPLDIKGKLAREED